MVLVWNNQDSRAGKELTLIRGQQKCCSVSERGPILSWFKSSSIFLSPSCCSSFVVRTGKNTHIGACNVANQVSDLPR